MNLRDVEKLLRLSKAKSQQASVRLGAVRRAQAALSIEIEALTTEIRPLEETDELASADLSAYGRRLAFLDRSAAEKKMAVAALEPARRSRERELQVSLGEESAWLKIGEEKKKRRKSERENRDEERREALAQHRVRT